jgi:hypothetical protein
MFASLARNDFRVQPLGHVPQQLVHRVALRQGVNFLANSFLAEKSRAETDEIDSNDGS